MDKKQKLLSLLCITVFLWIFPLQLRAEQFTVADTDLNIEIDTQSWKILTREAKEDELLKEMYGLDQETAMQWLEKNYIYLYGVFTEEDVYPHMELLIRKSEAVNVINLSKYSDKDIRALGKELAQDRKDVQYDIFQTDYKYAFLSYTDSGYMVREYYTAVNGESYTFTFQKMSDFTQEDIVQMQKLIKSASFEIHEEIDAAKEGGRRISVFTVFGLALFVFMLWRVFVKKKQQDKEEQFLQEIEELERKCLEDRKKQDKFEQK